MLVERPIVDFGQRRAAVHQIGGHLQHARRRARRAEADGVGHDAGEQVGGHVGVDRQPQMRRKVEQQLGRGRGLRIDQVDLAEQGIGGVVVDVDDRQVPGGRAQAVQG